MTGLQEIAALARLWSPPEGLPLSDWAERNIVLSSEYAAHPGGLELFNWQREIFDSFTDPTINEIVLMTATQLIKTMFIQSCIAYAIAAEPGPILVGEPNTTDAQTFSRERLGIRRVRFADQNRAGLRRDRIGDTRLNEHRLDELGGRHEHNFVDGGIGEAIEDLALPVEQL